MNVELAEKALESARANPEKFNMSTWFTGPRGGLDSQAEVTEDRVPPCGTTACFAGWVAFHHAPLGSKIKGSLIKLPGAGRYDSIEEYAKEALGITIDQACTLFFLDTIDQVERAVARLAVSPDATGTVLWRDFYDEADLPLPSE